MSDYFLEEDSEYPLQGYSGVPETDLFNAANYDVQKDDSMPTMSFST